MVKNRTIKYFRYCFQTTLFICVPIAFQACASMLNTAVWSVNVEYKKMFWKLISDENMNK